MVVVFNHQVYHYPLVRLNLYVIASHDAIRQPGLRTTSSKNLTFSFLFFFLFYFLTLQYCIGFAIYQNESATGIHVFPKFS